MEISPAAEAAVARWLSEGVTSLTHPVLAQLYRDCFVPLGIEADWFEAEPFSSLETGQPDGWLRRPRWNPARLDPAHPGAAALLPWAAQAGAIAVQVDGVLRLPESTDASADWNAIRPTVMARERARAFLIAAAASLLFDPAAAVIYRGGDAQEFVRRIWARMEEPTANTADAAANSPAPEPTAPPPPPDTSEPDARPSPPTTRDSSA